MKLNLSSIFLLIGLIYLSIPAIGKTNCDSTRLAQIILQKKKYQADYSPDTAILYCDSLLSCVRGNENSVYLPLALKYKGVAYEVMEKYDSSKMYYSMAIKLADKHHHDSISANAKMQLAGIYDILGYSDSVNSYYEQAIAYYHSQSDTLGMVKVYLNYSSSLIKLADYDKALQLAHKSLHLAKMQTNKHYYLLTLLNVGNVYEILEDYDKAIELYELCYKESKEYADYDPAARALTNMGIIHYHNKEYNITENHFLEAIRFYKKTENRKMQCHLYMIIANVYYKLGKKSQAYSALETSFKIAVELDLTYYQVSALINHGLFAKRDGNFTESEKLYKKALALSQKHGYQNETKKLYINLSNLYVTQEDFKLAYYYYIEYKGISDTILNKDNLKLIAELDAKYKNEENQAHILRLENENMKSERDKEAFRRQRGIFLWSGIFLLFALIMGIWLHRLNVAKSKLQKEQAVRELKDEKRKLAARSILEGQENERQRIARELHDGIGVLLSTASIHFTNINKEKADKNNLIIAQKANDFLQKAGTEIRRISHNMMPVVLMKFGLCDALEDLFDEVADAGQIEIEHAIERAHKRFPEKTEVVIYRIVQEMLNNTLKHAAASRIDFSFTISGDILNLLYKDDGLGFDTKNLQGKGNLGLSGIYSRVDYLNGKLKLDTAPEKGCTYHIEVPV